MKKSMKILCAVLALVLTLGIGIGGTLAYISKATGPVQNTFTFGNFNLTLTETDTHQDTDSNANTNKYIIVPGADLPKDPKVTISTPDGYENVESYVFVKVVPSANWPEKVHYAINTTGSGWTQVPGETQVWYKVVTPSKAGVELPVLEGNHVTVDADMTKADIEAAAKNGSAKLDITAYAIQTAGFNGNVKNAWTEVSGLAAK